MNWNAFKRLFHYLGRYKLRLILVMIAAVLSTLFTVLTPAVTGGITSELYDAWQAAPSTGKRSSGCS